MIFRMITAFILIVPAYLFADNGALYEKVESRVFQGQTAETIRGFYTNGFSLAGFQNALVDYRLGNMTTNVDLVRKSMTSLSNSLRDSTNVFTITYFGLAYSSVAFLTPNFFEKLPSLGQSFVLLDRAVDLYPGHYLPHFYRSMLKLMAPSIVGGSEETGLKDMEFVLSNMNTIRREDDYKAFIHFFYAVYWGDMKKDYPRADEFLSNANRFARSQDMISNINKYQKKYGEKRGKTS